ncbi:MAG: hypothetical protein HGGPFJEG_01518 [Ignavibacteria bacterium]|nr:hypothetical protein [Ignavibacteria bacterium]
MKISEELIAIKMCIKTISMKVKRLENISRQLKKQLDRNGISINGKLPKRISRDQIPLGGGNMINNLRNLIIRED